MSKWSFYPIFIFFSGKLYLEQSETSTILFVRNPICPLSHPSSSPLHILDLGRKFFHATLQRLKKNILEASKGRLGKRVCLWGCLFANLRNPFLADVPILYLLEAPENQQFSKSKIQEDIVQMPLLFINSKCSLCRGYNFPAFD